MPDSPNGANPGGNGFAPPVVLPSVPRPAAKRDTDRERAAQPALDDGGPRTGESPRRIEEPTGEAPQETGKRRDEPAIIVVPLPVAPAEAEPGVVIVPEVAPPVQPQGMGSAVASVAEPGERDEAERPKAAELLREDEANWDAADSGEPDDRVPIVRVDDAVDDISAWDDTSEAWWLHADTESRQEESVSDGSHTG